MPLVIISGHPASGKTTRARKLASSLEEIISRSENPLHKGITVHVVNDESIGIKRTAYAETRTEKDARAAFSSAIKRELGRGKIVIADGMNYIKGFRYQMYCEAKAMQTPSCCLHIATVPAYSRDLNSRIESSDPGTSYSSDLLENLIFRFEEPSSFARWDSPLFTLPADDAEPPSEAIFYALIGDLPSGTVRNALHDETHRQNSSETGLKRARPNLATVAPIQTDAGALYRVDRACFNVIKSLQEQQTKGMSKMKVDVQVGSVEGTKLELRLPEDGFTTAAMQRLRRDFVGLIRANPAMAMKEDDDVKKEFVSFINRRTWEDD